MKQFNNLLNGKVSVEGVPFEITSPIDQKVIGEGHLLSQGDISQIFETSLMHSTSSGKIPGLEKLANYLLQQKQLFTEQIVLETGYTFQDAKDIVDGSIELIANFEKYLHDETTSMQESKFSYAHNIPRRLKIIFKPYGIIAVMTPQNAPLILELTVLLNALAAGNSVILRPSSQCVGTVSLLIDALVETFPQEALQNVSIISCKATDFLQQSYEKAQLIHYIGSSRHGLGVLSGALENNIKALVDGEGSSTVVIDKSAVLDEAVNDCCTGIIRSNGELCSSIRLIAVEHTRYDEFRRKLIDKLSMIHVGDPHSEQTDMGPLFHEKQAENLLNVAKKYNLISGEFTQNNQGKNYITPLLLELQPDATSFLHEEVYGPIVGIVPYENDEWKKWLLDATYHLNNAVFSKNQHFIDEFIATSRAARIIINDDPSIESVFEPWGGFLPSGANDVSFWYDKYRKAIQIDTD